jgi:hypothetical protein
MGAFLPATESLVQAQPYSMSEQSVYSHAKHEMC